MFTDSLYTQLVLDKGESHNNTMIMREAVAEDSETLFYLGLFTMHLNLTIHYSGVSHVYKCGHRDVVC